LETPAGRGFPHFELSVGSDDELVAVDLALEIVEAVLARLREPADERTRDAMIAGEVNGC